ncbi:hypothetical protein H5410_028466 [Solanum commersonii]|uniref:KIB1-4 beta-propeller domain-containing protein n=1 Tax=Solanum commersonii TaxID=4109 RepID=A0A9J5Z7L5_SOLCO|nr:hypothetical protein H5410_028466 [Solanum commersonii]
MADWAELPNAVIAHIANRVKVIEDFIAFRAVCTWWRISTIKEDFDVFLPQLPLLMLGAKDDDYREFYSLTKKKIIPIFLPQARGPHGGNRWSCIDRGVLSGNPSLTSDYVLMVHHYGPASCLVIWRPGDLDWTHIDVVNHGGVAALIYHKGEFYSMSYCGEVRAYQVAGPNVTDQPVVQTRLLAEIDAEMYDNQLNLPDVKYYLVELSGALLLVTRFANVTYDDPNSIFHTVKFKVSELDVIKGELKEEMKTLGYSSIFLGRNWASCIDSSKFDGIKPNHIYFTDDGLEYDRAAEGGAGKDMGAYNLEDEKFESFYPGESTSLICPPVWVMSSVM